MTTRDDRARGFAALPRQPRRSARSPWGRAWTKALEDTSLDQGLLARGRKYARGGRVGPITVSPGRVTAAVHDDQDSSHQAVIHLDPLTETQWERLLAEIAARAGHIAALLDNDIPPEVVTAAEDAGVPLLPAIGDLDPDCACPDWGHPCAHAAALGYQTSWLLDEDPFVLLLVRGRGRRELLEELQRRTAPAPHAGTPAIEAYARRPRPLPAPPPPPLPDPADGPLAEAAARARRLLEGAVEEHRNGNRH
jgi:uncharacterized Zn finger protein